MHDDRKPKSNSKKENITSLILGLFILVLGICFIVLFTMYQEIAYGFLAMFDCSIGLVYTMESINKLKSNDDND